MSFKTKNTLDIGKYISIGTIYESENVLVTLNICNENTRFNQEFLYIIKTVRYPNKNPKHHEIEMLDKVENIAGVLKPLLWCDDRINKEYHILMKNIINSCDIKDYIKNRLFDLSRNTMNEYEAIKILKQLTYTSLRMLNDEKVVHCDLKLENVIVNPATLDVYIIDFDCAQYITDENEVMTYINGTEDYFPPEFITNKNFKPVSQTVWCLGIMLHEMLKGYVPFESEYEILNKNLDINDLNENIQHLLTHMLHKNPLERMTLVELKNYLDKYVIEL